MTFKKAFISILAGATMATGLASPANAAPTMPLSVARPAQTDVQQVDVRIGFSINNGTGYYNGHRGYRDRRPGYRLYNGFWFPGFVFDLRPAPIYRERPYYRERVYSGRMSRAHVQWCFDRYRSYRPYDNSWQPNNGPRRVCRSPFG